MGRFPDLGKPNWNNIAEKVIINELRCLRKSAEVRIVNIQQFHEKSNAGKRNHHMFVHLISPLRHQCKEHLRGGYKVFGVGEPLQGPRCGAGYWLRIKCWIADILKSYEQKSQPSRCVSTGLVSPSDLSCWNMPKARLKGQTTVSCFTDL